MHAVTQILLLLLVALSGATLSGASFRSRSGDPAPNVIRVCERHRDWVCGTWQRTSYGYFVEWKQGMRADITITRFDADSIVLLRTDRPEVRPYTTAIYRAAHTDGRVRNGSVTWIQGDRRFDGVWNAEW